MASKEQVSAKRGRQQEWLLVAGCLLLVTLTVAVYWRSLAYGFINFDDPDYVTDNARLLQGLSIANILWAFTTFHASNWHPLTWLSHMLDMQLFGLSPAGHRTINVALHIATALLLFLALKRMTTAPWKSLAVAALFALHPLHAESVVWISERKDVLCGLFWMTTLLAYHRYVQYPRTGAYLLLLCSFAAALLSKPMAVTLPFVLLLLDFWPLRRWGGQESKGVSQNQRPSQTGRLIREKIPFLALSAGSAVVTILAQRHGGTISSLEALPLTVRLGNAIFAYAGYLYKTIWPAKLSIIYPVRLEQPPILVAAALLLVVAITWIVWQLKHSRPYLFVGWFWFIGTLVPVIGLVQVGVQAMADRYTYIPLIGVFLMVTWLWAEIIGRQRQAALGATAGLLVLVLAGASLQRVGIWRNSESLFRQALTVTSGNYVAHNNLGAALAERGSLEEAQEHFERALQFQPNHVPALFGMGKVLAERGQLDSALGYLGKAASLQPENSSAHFNYAVVLAQQRHLDQARAHYLRALELKPDFLQAHNNLAQLLIQAGEIESGLEHARAAIRLNPKSFQARFNAGNAHFLKGELDVARDYYQAALRINPDFADAHLNLAKTLVPTSAAEAEEHFKAVSRLQPNNVEAHQALAQLALRQNRPADALAYYEKLLKTLPDRPEVLNNCAWVLATASDPRVKNPTKAVELALRACKLTGRQQPELLSTLAAAYAESGNFPEAVAAQEQALEIWIRAGHEQQVQKARQRLELYRAGQTLGAQQPA